MIDAADSATLNDLERPRFSLTDTIKQNKGTDYANIATKKKKKKKKKKEKNAIMQMARGMQKTWNKK